MRNLFFTIISFCLSSQAFAAAPYVQKFCYPNGSELLTLKIDQAANKVEIDVPKSSDFPRDWTTGLKLGTFVQLEKATMDQNENKPKSKAVSGIEFGVSTDTGISYGIELIQTADKVEHFAATGVYMGDSCE